MRQWKRYIAALFFFLFLFFLTVLLLGNFVCFVSSRGNTSFNALILLKMLLSERRSTLLLLVLLGIDLLLVFWCLWGNPYLSVKSKMYEVLPGFEIPYPSGQGQHGTAWWMERQQFSQHFAEVNMEGGLTLPAALQKKYSEEAEAIQNGYTK